MGPGGPIKKPFFNLGEMFIKLKDGKVGQDNSNSVEHGPFFRLKTSRDLPCGQALFLNFVLGSFKVI